MGSGNTSGGMRSDPVLELARRGAVRLAAGGGAVLSAASLIQVLAGEPAALITLVAALPTTVIAVIMLRQERPNVIALLSLITAFALAAEVYAIALEQTTYVAGVGAEIVVFGLGILAVFIARERPVVVAIGFLAASALIVLVAQLYLNGATLEIASDIVVMLAVLGTLMFLVIRVLQSLSVSRGRHSDLARVIPVAALELDVSAVIAQIDKLADPNSSSVGSPGKDVDLYAEMLQLVRMSYSNETADRLAESLGHWREFASGPNADLVRREAIRVVMAVWQGTDAGSGEVSVTTRTGSRQDFIYRWALGQVDGRTVPGTLVIAATDVTRLRQAERELERQLEERDQFVASVSHELRTPLTSIMGLTQELVDRPGAFTTAERAELLGIVAAESRDVVDIVEDLLVTARAEAGQLNVSIEPLQLASEARRVADLVGGVSVNTEPVWTAADPVRLRQVLRNLLSNAKRHGGSDVRLSVRAKGEQAFLEVRDDGDPLAPADREQIFLPYERVGSSNVVGSVGLGLHVARLLTHLMSGDLTYDHDGRDTVFTLELPLTEAPPTSNEQLDVGFGGEVEERSGAGNVAAFD